MEVALALVERVDNEVSVGILVVSVALDLAVDL